MDPDDYAESTGDGFEERHRILAEQVEHTARSLGLYMEHIAIALPPGSDPADPRWLMVLTSFAIGDVAWQPRTINREQDAFDRKFDALAEDAEEEELRRIRKLHEEGKFPGVRKDLDE